MSHFYGVLRGSRGPVTRCGTKNSGVETTAASWSGAIVTTLFQKDGVDMYRVTQVPWRGAGIFKVLAEGEVGS